MAKIKRIMVHCTADPVSAVRSRSYFKHLFFDVYKWTHYGYHYLVHQNGDYEPLQPLPEPVNGFGFITDATLANGCKGANSDTIHVAYVGGLSDDLRRCADTRTIQQRNTLILLIAFLRQKYNVTEVIGHRDWPGVKKQCPGFDARKEYSNG